MTNTVRGIWWMVSAALFFACIVTCGRSLSGRYGAFEIVVLQTSISTLLMVPWLVKGGFARLRTRRPIVYGLRAVVAMLAMVSMFFALQTLPVADATALLYSAGLFTVLFAAILGLVGLLNFTQGGQNGAMPIVRPQKNSLLRCHLGNVGSYRSAEVNDIRMPTDRVWKLIPHTFSTPCP